MSHTNRHTPNRRTARAVAATRRDAPFATLHTLILSVLLTVLAGAAWMQLT